MVRPGAGTLQERNKEPIIIKEADQPPIQVHPSDLGGVLSAGQVFNIGVRLKTEKVRLWNQFKRSFHSLHIVKKITNFQ